MATDTTNQTSAADQLSSENLEDGSRAGYKSKLKAFEEWLRRDNFDHLLTAEPGKLGFYFDWQTICAEPDVGKKSFAAELFHEYAANFKRRNAENNKPVSKSHMTGVRSAWNWCCNANHYVMPRDFTSQTKKTLRAVGKRYAKAKARGELADNARVPLSYTQYHTLCKKLWEEGTMEAKELNAFIQLQWNITCRADSVSSLSLPSIKAFNDALQVMIYTSKTNQEGEDVEARHIYFNPLSDCNGIDMRYTDVGLALGAYLLAFPGRRGNLALFFGPSIQEKMKKGFATLIQKHHELLGIDQDDIHLYGLHSLRKGAGTFCTSGSVGGPSMVSVGRRMEHNMGVQNIYLKFEHAGDMFVGRVVAAFPLNEPEFDTLPPAFDPIPDNISDHVILTFGKATTTFSRQCFLRRILANIVYHSDWLLSQLQDEDAVLQNHIFRTAGLIQILKPMIRLGGGGITATGIPPVTSVLRTLRTQVEEMRQWKQEFLTAMEKKIEECSVGSGTITPAFLQQHINRALDAHLEGITDTLSTMGIAHTVRELPSSNENENSTLNLHYWPSSPSRPQAEYHVLPIDYKLPSCDIKTALQLWFMGNAAQKIRPLRSLKKNLSKEFTRANEAQKFSEWRTCLCYIENLIVSNWSGVFPAKPSAEQVEDAWNAIKNNLGIPSQNGRGRRNLGALKVTTFKRLLVNAGKITLKRKRTRTPRRSSRRRTATTV